MPSIDDSRRIQVTTRFFGQFKQVTQTRELLHVLTPNTTISSLLDIVFEQFPKLMEQALNEQSKLHSWVIILINGRNMNIYEGLNTTLKEGDIVAIFPPIAGG
jgi:molybdopterin synthase sulfur carrier subunit